MEEAASRSDGQSERPILLRQRLRVHQRHTLSYHRILHQALYRRPAQCKIYVRCAGPHFHGDFESSR